MGQHALLLVTLLLGSDLASTQQERGSVHQQTAAPPSARFEVVQSLLAAKWTFRLDRFTGHVSQLVRTADGDNAWEEMPVIGLSPIAASRPRFQIFVSGLAARFTFLVDTDNGNTWVVVTGTRKKPDGTEYEVHVWQPFAGQ